MSTSTDGNGTNQPGNRRLPGRVRKGAISSTSKHVEFQPSPDTTQTSDVPQSSRQTPFSAQKGKRRAYRAYMRPVKSATARRRVSQAYRSRLPAGSKFSGMNQGRRELLHDAIFEVENAMESQGDGRPDHPTVVQLRAARNLVLDDLGWNEKRKGRAA